MAFGTRGGSFSELTFRDDKWIVLPVSDPTVFGRECSMEVFADRALAEVAVTFKGKRYRINCDKQEHRPSCNCLLTTAGWAFRVESLKQQFQTVNWEQE